MKTPATACSGYIICATPRTGSTLLCDLLAATGLAGAPDSFFMRDVDPLWSGRWGLPSPEGRQQDGYCSAYLEAAIAAGRGGTEIFGLRLMHENLGDLMEIVGRVHRNLPSDRERLRAAFGDVLYVHLLRKDKLAQAVSMVKAEQTGLWHIAPDGRELERLSAPSAPEYDFARIAAKLDALRQDDAGWLAWFSEQGIEPLEIAYETLSEDPVRAVRAICDRLDVRPAGLDDLKPGVAKLADEVSRGWMARFRAEAGGDV